MVDRALDAERNEIDRPHLNRNFLFGPPAIENIHPLGCNRAHLFSRRPHRLSTILPQPLSTRLRVIQKPFFSDTSPFLEDIVIAFLGASARAIPMEAPICRSAPTCWQTAAAYPPSSLGSKTTRSLISRPPYAQRTPLAVRRVTNRPALALSGSRQIKNWTLVEIPHEMFS